MLRYKHYGLKTEQAYGYRVKFFVRWCGKGAQIRRPCDKGAPEVTQFLTMLANERKVSVSTHHALSALLFFYQEVHHNFTYVCGKLRMAVVADTVLSGLDQHQQEIDDAQDLTLAPFTQNSSHPHPTPAAMPPTHSPPQVRPAGPSGTRSSARSPG